MHIYCITIFRTMNRQVLNRGMTILTGTVLVTTLMMMTAPSVYAASPDFSIEDAGVDEDGHPFLTVEGTAGGTKPDEKDKDDIHAYVFITKDATFAVTSHPGITDTTEVEDQGDYHAHKLVVEDGCVDPDSIEEDGDAIIEGKKVAVDTNVDEGDLESVLTAVLSSETKDGICVVKQFDSFQVPN
jgi:hypothetical protein